MVSVNAEPLLAGPSSALATACPMVAIVGRPNVGKSTLFNRLVGRRLALVEDLPGTTRDRLEAEVTWGATTFTIVDTGGLLPEPDSDLARLVRGQVLQAIAEAQVILFLVDVKDGVTPLDEEIAAVLRRSSKPLLLVVNKVDSEQRQPLSYEFYTLGLGETLAISAYHDRGIEALLDRVVALVAAVPTASLGAPLLKIAIVGRPNVGKSSLLNRLLGEERVLVDPRPGTTRDAVDTLLTFQGEPLLLIDTAGLRRRGHIGVGIERHSVLRALQAMERSDVVLLVVDATEGVTAQDTHIGGAAKEAGKGLVLLINKWDCIGDTPEERLRYQRQARRRFHFFPSLPLLFVSATTGFQTEHILPQAKAVFAARCQRIPTGPLNQMMAAVLQGHPPPRQGNRVAKIYYVTQTGINPPTLVFFVNDPELLHFSYQRYLENQLRRAYGFAGTPLRLIFRPRGER